MNKGGGQERVCEWERTGRGKGGGAGGGVAGMQACMHPLRAWSARALPPPHALRPAPHTRARAGVSRSSTTFGNDCLASSEEFQIGAVELWGLT